MERRENRKWTRYANTICLASVAWRRHTHSISDHIKYGMSPWRTLLGLLIRCPTLYVKSLQLMSLRWRHNGRDSVSNHQPHDCLLNRVFRRWPKKTSKLRVTGLRGIHRGPVNSPHKWPVTRKMFPFDDVIMWRSASVDELYKDE